MYRWLARLLVSDGKGCDGRDVPPNIMHFSITEAVFAVDNAGVRIAVGNLNIRCNANGGWFVTCERAVVQDAVCDTFVPVLDIPEGKNGKNVAVLVFSYRVPRCRACCNIVSLCENGAGFSLAWSQQLKAWTDFHSGNGIHGHLKPGRYLNCKKQIVHLCICVANVVRVVVAMFCVLRRWPGTVQA